MDSIVAVHGLYGDHKDMWTIDETDNAPSRNWLKDHIYERYPGSRILTFGYDASNTRARISTIAGIKEKALQLLDDLVKFRKELKPVRAMPYPRY